MSIGHHPTFDIHFLPPKGNKARKLALILMAVAPFLFGLLALALGQDANWDFRNYHWYNAYAFLNGRTDTLDLLPSQTPFFYNPLMDVPFFLLATHLPARVAGFILATVQGLNFPLLFMLAHATLLVPNARQKVLASTLVAALGLLGGGGIAQIGTTFYDNITSIGLFLSALWVLRNLETLIQGQTIRAFQIALIGGLPAGLMMGLKLPSVIFCVGLCFALLCVSGSFKRRILIGFAFGLGVLAGCAVSLGPWAFFLQTHFGNPLFPYFNDLFHSPLAPPKDGRDIQFVPTNWHDRLLFPLIFAQHPTRVGEIPWQDIRIPLLYLLLPVAGFARLIFGRNRSLHDKLALPLPARYLTALAVIAYVVWLFMFAIYRYALPLEMLSPLLIIFAVGLLPLRLPTRGLVAAFLLGAIAFTIQPGNWTRRDTWLESYMQVDLPALPNDSNLMVLMAGFEPYSHIIPALPPKIPVLRIQSNFSRPEYTLGINDVIRKRIQDHKGDFKLLIPLYDAPMADKALHAFGLALLPQSCQKVQDHLFEATYSLCDVQRQKTETP